MSCLGSSADMGCVAVLAGDALARLQQVAEQEHQNGGGSRFQVLAWARFHLISREHTKAQQEQAGRRAVDPRSFGVAREEPAVLPAA